MRVKAIIPRVVNRMSRNTLPRCSIRKLILQGISSLTSSETYKCSITNIRFNNGYKDVK